MDPGSNNSVDVKHPSGFSGGDEPIELARKLSSLLPFKQYVELITGKKRNEPNVKLHIEAYKEVADLYRKHLEPATEPPFGGISLKVLQAVQTFLVKHHGSTKLTTGQVWTDILQPLTAMHGCSIIELVSRDDKDATSFLHSTKKDTGVANIFVSHAWGGSFHEMVMALARVEKEKSYSDIKQKYYWIDVFSNNQYQEMHFRSTFSSVIANVQRTVCILHPWKEPEVLSRCWCLWEIFCSIQVDAPIEFVLSKREESALRNTLHMALVNGQDPHEFEFGPNTRWYPVMDLKNAKATNPEDEKYIKERITSEASFKQIEAMVISVLKSLYAREITGTAITLLGNRRALVNAAFFLRSLNRLEEDAILSDDRMSFNALAKECKRVILSMSIEFASKKMRNRLSKRYAAYKA